jgi:hypothetical protein
MAVAIVRAGRTDPTLGVEAFAVLTLSCVIADERGHFTAGELAEATEDAEACAAAEALMLEAAGVSLS